MTTFDPQPSTSTDYSVNRPFSLGKSISSYFQNSSIVSDPKQLFQSSLAMSSVNNFFSKSDSTTAPDMFTKSDSKPISFVKDTPSDSDVVFGNSSNDLFSGSEVAKAATASKEAAENPTSSISETPQAIESQSLTSVLSDAGKAVSLDSPYAIAGLGLGALDTSVTSFNNQSNILAARQGNGPEGHAFDAVNQAENQANFSSFNSNIQSALIAGGSTLGPYGLIGGIAAAGLEEGISQAFAPSSNITQGLDGSMTSASDN